jgi:hypothetical protein
MRTQTIMTSRRISLLVAIWVGLSVGCATGYSPREPGRIHIVTTANGRLLEKDGKLYSMSGFRNGLVEAVSGDPAAEAHARTFVSRTRTGTVLIAVGVAGCAGGLALNTTEPGHLDRKIAGRGIAIASMVMAFGALLAVATAQTHLYDAINTHNDDVSRRLTPGGDLATRSCLRAMAPRAP